MPLQRLTENAVSDRSSDPAKSRSGTDLSLFPPSNRCAKLSHEVDAGFALDHAAPRKTAVELRNDRPAARTSTGERVPDSLVEAASATSVHPSSLQRCSPCSQRSDRARAWPCLSTAVSARTPHDRATRLRMACDPSTGALEQLAQVSNSNNRCLLRTLLLCPGSKKQDRAVCENNCS